MAEKRSTGLARIVRRKLQGVAAALAALAVLALAGALLAGCGGAGSTANGNGAGAAPAAGQAGVMNVADAKAMLEQHPEALVLDVREPSEWNDDLGHIDRAKLIPSGEVGQRVGEIAEYKDKPVLVVCRVGVRSHHAAQFLARQGFTQVSNLSGGMDAWRKAGY
ncbi:MAG: rhodanese-like domain-containing protein [Candidatus Eisenbacteria bacterium]